MIHTTAAADCDNGSKKGGRVVVGLKIHRRWWEVRLWVGYIDSGGSGDQYSLKCYCFTCEEKTKEKDEVNE
ncbi:hypothetical protein VNO78_22680 [Psophocarpus tetragonolobus]|uniref:Uncharacterized protein n=1 Tax=Psophocarpus tetragonolobus TaxID=3891 RepID=A0AAN9XCH7_PSOTE